MSRPEPQRCACPACLALDRRWPADGYQLRLIPTNERSGEAHMIDPAREPELTPRQRLIVALSPYATVALITVAVVIGRRLLGID